eukprot:5841971-Amphidinium_carterae.1
MKYINQHRPLMILFENVDSMDDAGPQGGSNNMDVLLSQMASAGYEGQRVLTNATEFGLPARRKRVYIFFVRVTSNPILGFTDRPVDAIFTTMRALLMA